MPLARPRPPQIAAQVLRAEHQGVEPGIGGGDRAEPDDAPRGLDDGQDADGPRGQPAPALDPGQEPGHLPDRLGRFGFREDVRVGRAAGLSGDPEVLLEAGPLRVDAHQALGAAEIETRKGPGRPAARLLLPTERHAVLEIEDDAVHGQPCRLLDLPGLGGGAEEEGPSDACRDGRTATIGGRGRAGPGSPRAHGAGRIRNRTERSISTTTVPSWFSPRCRRRTMPRSGREADGRVSSTSVSA